MLKNDWKLTWSLYRRHGVDYCRAQMGKDASLMAIDSIIARNSLDTLEIRSLNRRRILDYARSMGKKLV